MSKSGKAIKRKLIQPQPDEEAGFLSEIIRERDQEDEILSSVGHAIASIRDKNDFIHVIRQTLKSRLKFADIAITHFNLQKQTFQVLMEDCEQTNLHPDFESIAFREYPIADGIHNVIMNSEHTVVLSVSQLLGRGMVHIEFLHQAGIKELAGIRLQHNSEVIGTLVLLSVEENSFSAADQHLIKQVSYHFSTAMANILYNEEIQKREKEKEILLTIGSELVAIRNKEDLLPILKKQLENLSFYNDITIAKVDSNNQTFSAFLINEDPGRQQHPEYYKVRNANQSFPDGVFEIALRSKRPVIFDLEILVKQPEPPSYIKFLYENGTIEMAGVSLRDRNTEIGVLFLFSPKKQSFSELQMNLVQGIGNLLGSVVANILAHEEIKDREHEKSILLSLSNEIAAVRNKEDLFLAVNDKIKKLFSTKGFGISLINEDGKTHSPFLVGTEDRLKNHNDFEKVVSEKYSVNDGFFERVINSEDPVIFKIKELSADKTMPAYVKLLKELGINQMVGATLRTGKQNLGCLFFYLDSESTDGIRNKLLNSICSQISIALSNIVANEKIEHQLLEIKKYKERLEDENTYLQEEVSSRYIYSDIIGNGLEMQKVFHQLSQVSYANSTVLLLGETGTGKELIARAIHNSSPRKDNLMVKVNCAALPANLIESELFGHEKGSFTGATERRIGKFELANHGTLFLDEVGEMAPDLQMKFLRALQEKEIERIGGKSTIKTDVRIIAATNRNLQKEVDEGGFRRDLFYRLNVFPITLPPLRERKEDIPILVSHFINKYSKNIGKIIKNISDKAMNELMAYSWPGNVRELEHSIERSILLAPGVTIKDVHLPISNIEKIKDILKEDYLKSYEENEREHILRVLNKCNGKIFGLGGAADILGLHVSTLNSKLKKLGIHKKNLFALKE